MSDLLEKLTNSRSTEREPIEPRFSRKTKRVSVTVYIHGVAMDCSVQVNRLDKSIDRVCAIADGSGPLQMLLDELINARQKYSHVIDGKQKARGVQTGRNGISYKLRYASAWTYCFIRQQWKLPTENRNLFLRTAEACLRRRLREEELASGWDNAKRSWQSRLLTAFLVGNAYSDDRKRHDLKDPLDEFAKFHADSFYRTYVQPKLKHVESRIKKRPELLNSLSNAYLRKIFFPRISDASFSES